MYVHITDHAKIEEMALSVPVLTERVEDKVREPRLPAEGMRFFTDKGGWYFHPDDGFLDAHFFYLPQGRGEFARKHSKYILDKVSKIGEIMGEININNLFARRFVESLSCKPIEIKGDQVVYRYESK